LLNTELLQTSENKYLLPKASSLFTLISFSPRNDLIIYSDVASLKAMKGRASMHAPTRYSNWFMITQKAMIGRVSFRILAEGGQNKV